MDNQTLLTIMTVFVVIAGISLLLQLGTLFGLYRTAKSVEQKITALMPKVESLLPKVEGLIPKVEALIPQVGLVIESTHKIVESSRQQIFDIGAKTSDILDVTKRQLLKVETVLDDASARAKVQLEKAEMVIDDTMSRAHETVSMVHNGITRPIREVQGVAAGVRAAISHMAKGGRPSVAQATHDDEMFI
jgi:hypothetical protein